MDKKVLASVEGREISQANVMEFLNEVGPQVAMQFQSPDGMKKVVDELVGQELLFLEAKENKLEEEEEFIKVLEGTKDLLLKNYAISKLIGATKVESQEVMDYYEENKEHFSKPETVEASHILVDELETAEQVRKEIEDGLSFADAAKKYSTCPSKEQGGALGPFTRGQMVGEFEEVAFQMEEGELSQPVKSQFGYHIIDMGKKTPASQMDFEEVKDQVTDIVLKLKQQDIYMEKIGQLEEVYKVERFD